MSDLQDRTLARLRRCERWAEERRVGGYIILHGMTAAGHWRNEELDEKTMIELLKAGFVECEASPRIQEGVSYSSVRNREPHEVTVKYWKVVEKANHD